MTTVLEDIQHSAQNHPLLLTFGCIAIIPGAYLITASHRFSNFEYPQLPQAPAEKSTTLLPSYVELSLLVTDFHVWSEGVLANLTRTAQTRTRHRIRAISALFLDAVAYTRSVRIPRFPFGGLPLYVIVSILPGLVILISGVLPNSWARRHQTTFANLLHLVGVVSFAHSSSNTSHLLGAALVMAAFQHTLGREGADAILGGESGDPQSTSAVETTLAESHAVVAKSEPPNQAVQSTIVDECNACVPTKDPKTGDANTKPGPIDVKDREIVRLQRKLTEVKTSSKATEVQLRAAKADLNNAREALNGTYAEYTSLREELKTVKQALGRDHQAIVYRKDIELFALRKANEQKAKYLKEQDAKFEEINRQQKATVEVKNAQLKLLKTRIELMQRHGDPRSSRTSTDDGDQALEVRLLRIRKGRGSMDSEDEKDAIIAKLQHDLAQAATATEAVVDQQAELQRAWAVAKKLQGALDEEKNQHAQTREKLEEATVKLAQEEEQKKGRAGTNGWLPTINEDAHDTKELEAMFDAAQEDNLRLYSEVEALERRVREANSRMFIAEQNAEALRHEYSLERAINSDIDQARPSVVHQVHFQRMESELKNARNMLAVKEEEVEILRNTITEKDYHVRDLRGEVDAAVSFHTQDQDEIERLKQSVTELQSTKEQLMLDHERLASQRTRQRVVSTDRTSARSSGVTLVQETSPLSRRSDERPQVDILPPVPSLTESTSEESIQTTPKRHIRNVSSPTPMITPNRWSLMSQAQPPAELREIDKEHKRERRKSLNIRAFVKKIYRKDDGLPEAKRKKGDHTDEDTNLRPSTAMTASDEPRSPTAVPPVPPIPANIRLHSQEMIDRPMTAALPRPVRPTITRTNSPRYYATELPKEREEGEKTGDEKERPGTANSMRKRRDSILGGRKSWTAATQNKLKRRSMY